tara:strand:+ start:864 stop:1724 length:861 start_codon:yes stop_codon:yes gene_type:complete
MGPAGSGKTYTALTVAKELGPKVAVLDTERGSASKYAGLFAFDVVELDSFDPRRYVEVIEAADQAGYDVLIIDSLSHAWSGKGGALQMVDEATARSKSRNSYTAWREVTPLHNALVDAILGCSCHVITTMRTKTEYVLEDNGKGGKVPRKMGMAPVQRDGMDYEFDVVGDMDWGHTLVVTKSRIPELADVVIKEPGAKFAKQLAAWVGIGEERPKAASGDRELTADGLRALLSSRMNGGHWDGAQARALIGSFGAEKADDLNEGQRRDLAAILTSKTGPQWSAEVK